MEYKYLLPIQNMKFCLYLKNCLFLFLIITALGLFLIFEEAGRAASVERKDDTNGDESQGDDDNDGDLIMLHHFGHLTRDEEI